MPPKKAVKAENGDAGDDKFRWTAENDRKLLIMAIRANVPRAEYEKFVEALPTGASFEGVRQRYGKLRREQQKIFEEMGWSLPDGAAKTAKTNGSVAGEKPAIPKGKKRGAKAVASEDDNINGSKKARIEDDDESIVKEEVDEA